jgi:hypothetical protein
MTCIVASHLLALVRAHVAYVRSSFALMGSSRPSSSSLFCEKRACEKRDERARAHIGMRIVSAIFLAQHRRLRVV